MSTALLQRACGCAKKDERKLQRRASPGATHAGFAPPIVHAVLREPGVPLDERARPLAERVLGPDFARVRIHTDSRAAESASAVGALAYTVGPHIVFGAGCFVPGSPEGDHLLAHELAHVAQQGNAAIPSALAIGEADTAFEQQAERVAAQAQAAPYATAPPTVMRKTYYDCRRLGPGNCNGKDCKGASGRDGKCLWGGIAVKCNCRETTSDEAALARIKEIFPAWLLAILSAAALAVIIACFATGACELAAIVTACGYATAMIVVVILREAGVEVTEA